MNVREYLASKGLRWEEEKRPSGTNGIMNCPFCDDSEKKFAINLETGFFNCYHKNKCGVTGGFNKLRNLFGDKGVPVGPERAIAPKIRKHYKKPRAIEDIMPVSVVGFFRGRQIDMETLLKYRVTGAKGAIAFQYFKNDELVNIKYRGIEEKKFWSEKDCEPVLYGHDLATGSTLIITEGEIDAMSMFDYGFKSVVSVPSGVDDLRWIENEWDWLEQFSVIYLCFDMDEAGRESVGNVAIRLGKWRCYDVSLPMKDANACLMGGVERTAIQKAIECAQGFNIEELANASSFAAGVKKLFADNSKRDGVPTAFKGLTAILRGWRPTELTVWSGRNGSGKTTLLNQIMVDLFKRGEVCCIASLEMVPERLLRWLAYQYMQRDDITDADIDSILEKIDPHLYLVNIIDEVDPDAILEIFAFAAKKYGVKHFFLDSLMRLSFKNSDDNVEVKNFVKKYVDFAVKYGVHVHLVAHPRKGATDDEKPGNVDISGTSNITNLAHNVMIVWRPSVEMQDRARERDKEIPDSMLYIRKNREHGSTGSLKLKFIEGTKTYVELDF
jgi:twinkle protein